MEIIMRPFCSTFLLFLMSSAAFAQSAPPPYKHLLIYRTVQDARMRCPFDEIVWASTTSHALYLPGDKHYAHTHGGYACESEGRALGYRGPTAHT
jgi:hypothetical protein